jgi:pyruvate,water dikinase
MVIYQSEDQSSISAANIPDVIVYDNSNIQKVCSGVTTPLTFHFTKRIYASIYRQTVKTLSLSDKVILKNEDLFQNLIGLIKGRIYYNVNSWYRGLQLFQSLNDTQVGLKQMMGLSDPLKFQGEELTWKKKFILLGAKCVDFPLLLINFMSLKSKTVKFLAKMQHCCSDFYLQDFSKMSIQELKNEKENIDTGVLSLWTTPVINDLYIWITCGDIVNKLKKAGLKNPEEFVNKFLTEEESVASMQPARQMHRLAIEASYQPDLKHLINRMPQDIHQQVETRFHDFHLKVMLFIDKYGDKTTGELKLETQTMRLNPFVFYTYLRDCLRAQISEIRATSQTQEFAKKALEKHIADLPASQSEKIMAKICVLNKALINRELFKLERSRVFGMYRTLYAAFGSRFEKSKWIEKASDIFYLTEDEILSCGNGKEFVFDTLIATRKQEYKSYETESSPSRIFISNKITDLVKEMAVNKVAPIQGFDPSGTKIEVA